MINKKTVNNNLYLISDLALASAIYLYYPIKTINKSNPQKAYFIFKKNKNINAIIERYWCGDLKVEPQLYFNSIKALKNRIYNT